MDSQGSKDQIQAQAAGVQGSNGEQLRKRKQLPEDADSDENDGVDEAERVRQKQVEAAWRQVEQEEDQWEDSVLHDDNNIGVESDNNQKANVVMQDHTFVPSKKVVVLGGSSLLQSMAFSGMQKRTLLNGVVVSESSDMVFISRHTCNETEEYSQPHQVDHRKIWQTIRSIQPSVVLGVCSVGSLQPDSIEVGSILCPTDWLNSTFAPAYYFEDAKAHVRPVLDQFHRNLVLDAIAANDWLRGFLVKDKSELVYCQTRGPRFETKAEIRMIKTFADVVGMTAGDEATLACELGIPYVMLCFVDNLAHGLSRESDSKLDNIEVFRRAQRENLERVERTVGVALHALKGYYAVSKEIPSNQVDMLVRARYVATVNAEDRVINHGVVAVRNGEIVGVHAADDFGIPSYSPKEIVDLPDSMLMPGLINAHTHAAMSLMRGFGDDLKLTDWLVTKIWPAEARCVSKEYVRDGTRLAIEEMLASGTTTFNDVYFFPEEIESICVEEGIRAVVGLVIIEFPSAMAKDGDDYLRLIREHLANKNKSSLVTYGITPHAPYSVSEEHIIEAKQLAKSHNCIFHTHLHECVEEVEASEKLDRKSGFCHRCDIACRPLSNLNRIGILDHTCSFAHMTQLTEDEIAVIAEKKCSVVHCPASNMKLASGFCPVEALLKAGVNVALGTDGACSNNSLDMIAEIKLAALIGKGVAKSATAVNARQAMRMATINGAKALGLESVCGSLEAGKRADMIAVDLLNRNACRPVFNPVSTFVYSGTRDCVRAVWVDGERKIFNGVRVNGPPGTSEADLRACAERWQKRLDEVVEELESV